MSIKFILLTIKITFLMLVILVWIHLPDDDQKEIEYKRDLLKEFMYAECLDCHSPEEKSWEKFKR